MSRLCFLCGKLLPRGTSYCQKCARKTRGKIPRGAFANFVGITRKKLGLSFNAAVKKAKVEYRKQKRDIIESLKG